MRPSTPPLPPLSESVALRLAGLALAGLVLAIYWPALWGDFVGYDDFYYVYRNPDVLRGLSWRGAQWAFTSLREYNWHPLAWLSLQLDAQLYGLFAPGYHATSLVLHAANVLLFLTLLHRTTNRLLPALAAAALFAVHPLHVESVAWISERKDVLSTFFWLACMLTYAQYAARPSWRRYALSLALFCLGLMAKSMLVTLPCVLLLFDYWPLRRFGAGGDGERRLWGLPLPGWRLVLEKVPFLAAALAVGLVTVVAQADTISGLGALPLWARLLNSGVAYLMYLGKTALPLGLAPFYPHPYTEVSAWGGTAGLLAVAALSVLAWRQARQRPWLFVGWFWFAGALAPVIGILQVGSQAWADRYAYVPHLGLFLALAWGGREFAGRLRLRRRGAAAAVLALVAWFSVLTFRQSGLWVDAKTLFTHTARVTERNYVAEMVLATVAKNEGDWPEHFKHYQRAVDYNPYYVSSSHAREGFLLLMFGQFRLARHSLVQALELDPRNVRALINLAAVYAYTGRPGLALDTLDRAAAIRPDMPNIQASKANILRLQEELRRRAREDVNATRPDGGAVGAASAGVPGME